jgi:UDP-N-acetyl-2-amino-2-deoxyglucuronate dehydrogenase
MSVAIKRGRRARANLEHQKYERAGDSGSKMEHQMTSLPVRTGLIGCGRIAVTHAIALDQLQEAEFVACCDSDEVRAREMAAAHNVPHVFNNVDTLLNSELVDAVLVCTPHPSHEAIVVAAARAGVHVLCEKPVSITLEATDRMIEETAKAGVQFGVIFQRRFWPAAQRIRTALDEGKLGNVTLGECSVRIHRNQEYYALDPWRGKWATEGGGVLMNQAVHSFDHFQWFMGKPVEVYGRYATLKHGAYIDVEDTVAATVVFENGALGVIQAASTFNKPDFGFRVSVHGDNGSTVSVWELPESQQGVNDIWTIPGEESLRVMWEEEDKDKPGFPLFHILQIQEFLQSVAAGRAPAITGSDARNSLELILAIYESSRTGRPVNLN